MAVVSELVVLVTLVVPLTLLVLVMFSAVAELAILLVFARDSARALRPVFAAVWDDLALVGCPVPTNSSAFSAEVVLQSVHEALLALSAARFEPVSLSPTHGGRCSTPSSKHASGSCPTFQHELPCHMTYNLAASCNLF